MIHLIELLYGFLGKCVLKKKLKLGETGKSHMMNHVYSILKMSGEQSKVSKQ
jgi:hypothetical protein